MLSPRLVVIDKINAESVPVLKPKNNSPVGVYRHSPKPSQVTPEWMELEERLVHAFYCLRRFERGQDLANPPQHISRQLASIVVLEKSSQPFVLETLDHAPSTLPSVV
jgi:hypothetical protein